MLCINATSSFPVPTWHRSCFNWFWAQQPPCLNCHLSISAFPFFLGARAAEEIRGAERTTAGSAQFELIFISQNGGIPGNSDGDLFGMVKTWHPFKWLSDLQRLGMKKVTAWITWWFNFLQHQTTGFSWWFGAQGPLRFPTFFGP